MFFRLLNSLRNRNRNLGSLSLPHTYPPMAITYDHEGTEVESLPTLYNLCDSVDKYNFIFQAQLIGIDSHARTPQSEVR
jgi:hypothetical protein